MISYKFFYSHWYAKNKHIKFVLFNSCKKMFFYLSIYLYWENIHWIIIKTKWNGKMIKNIN